MGTPPNLGAADLPEPAARNSLLHDQPSVPLSFVAEPESAQVCIPGSLGSVFEFSGGRLPRPGSAGSGAGLGPGDLFSVEGFVPAVAGASACE